MSGAYSNETTDASNSTLTDVQLVTGVGDAVYFGDTDKYDTVNVDISTDGVAGRVVWEYYNGISWVPLVHFSEYYNTIFNDSPWQYFTFPPPTNWATTAVNGEGTSYYYIRARAITAYSTTPVASQAVNYMFYHIPAAPEKFTSGVMNVVWVESQAIDYGYANIRYSGVNVGGNNPPDTPTNLGPSSFVNGEYSADNTPTLTFTLSDPDASDTVQYRIQIDDTSDFASPIVDYTSVLAAQGGATFTVGQAAGSGTYTTGSAGQTLSDTSFYWRVKAIDNSAAESAYATANSGSIAFIVDTTAPTVPGTPTTSSEETDTTPTFTWTASTDSGSGLASTPYTVQWCDNSSFTGCESNTDTSTATSYTFTTDLSTQTLYFRVKAEDAVGNESAYSSAGSISITNLSDDTTDPRSLKLISPPHKSYIAIERPWFVFRPARDNGGTGIDSYTLNVDNGDSGDFEISGIPPNGTKDKKTQKYIAKFSGFNTDDPSDDRISVQTLSGNAWGKTHNDGKLKEGKRVWSVKAIDKAGNTISRSFTVFADFTGPNSEVQKINDTSVSSSGNYEVTDSTPTFYGRVTDPLRGDKDVNRVASGPDEVELRFERKNSFGSYQTYSINTINFTDMFFSSDGSKVTDNSLNASDKYANFSYTFPSELSVGDYRLLVTGTDRVGNEGPSKTYSFSIVEPPPPPPPPLEPSPTPAPIVEVPPPEESIVDEIVDVITDVVSDTISVVEDAAVTVVETIIEVLNNTTPEVIIDIITELLEPIQPIIDQIINNIVVTTEVWLSTEPTVISNVRVVEIGEDYAIIAWNTNHHATSKVNYGETLSYGDDSSSGEKVLSHRIRIDGLEPGTTYYFEVMSQNKNYVYDAWHQFSTTTDGVLVREMLPSELELSAARKLVRTIRLSVAENPFVKNTAELAKIAARYRGTTLITLGASMIAIASSALIPVSGVYLPALSKIPVWNLPAVLVGMIKKKRHPWGIVYDSITKEPLDPVVVTLEGGKGERIQTVSDIYGRYEFIVEEGSYAIEADKSNYDFPSRVLTGKLMDEVYENLYLGGPFSVSREEKIVYNIPMDNITKDWNQEEKRRRNIEATSKTAYKASTFVFYTSFIISFIIFLVSQTLQNLIVISIFVLMMVYRRARSKAKPWGVVLDNRGTPVKGALVKLINVDIPRLSIPPVVTKEGGRYNFLVDKATYKLVVSIKQPDSTYKDIYESKNITISKKYGQVNENVALP